MALLNALASLFGMAPHPAVRSSLRARAPVTAHVMPNGADDLSRVDVTLENLSTGGARLRGTLHLHPGERVALSMRAGSARRFRVNGQVVYGASRRFECESSYGLRFVDLAGPEREALESYVDELRHADLIRAGLAWAKGEPVAASVTLCPCGCGGRWKARA